MTLEQLSYEYIKEADRLKARLCELKIMLKKAQTEEERTSLKRRMYYLYTEMRDAEQTAAYLFDYYNKDERADSAFEGEDYEKFMA